MVDLVREVQSSPVCIDHLHDIAVGMGGQMEVAWHFIDDNSAFNQTALLVSERGYGLLVEDSMVNVSHWILTHFLNLYII